VNAAPIVELVRNGFAESVHRGHLAVVDADGTLLAAAGDATAEIFVRSAVKPFQAAASIELAAEAEVSLDAAAVAIASASHAGRSDQQVEAARLLALAGLDESALACPEALPADLATLLDQRIPTRLAHNCSGKHAAFLLAHTAAGGAPERYLRRDARIQRRVRAWLAEAGRSDPAGPGVDGCGAPAWRLPLAGLALGFVALARRAAPQLAQVRDAMGSRPDLVGGLPAADTELMTSDGRIVAKRGAEGVLAAGLRTSAGVFGVALKVADGSARAAAPPVAAALAALGATVPTSCLEPAVLGGGRVQGSLRPAGGLLDVLRRLASG
jgi:L-asparaginase II